MELSKPTKHTKEGQELTNKGLQTLIKGITWQKCKKQDIS